MENLSIDQTVQTMPVLVAMVAAIIQIIKKMPQVKRFSEFLPLLSLVLAIGLAHLQGLEEPVMTGIMAGLMASGAYSVVKETKKTVTP